ncbi:MAG: TPM domain-containing protein [Candidatus Magasanikbacteria bacterium]|nr:TPM domain-containing protein [Candidatus Magasanikbacteria bacterium]
MNRIKALAFLITATLLFPVAVFGYANPGTPTGFVNDFADMFSQEQEDVLNQKLTNFEKETSNEIAIVTVPNLGEDTIENFAVELFAEWGIGKKKNDNGVLLLISRDDRKMRIEVGYGLEGALTDLQSHQIIQNFLVPNFKQELYFEGVNSALDVMIGATKGEYEAINKAETAQTGYDYQTIFFFVIFVVISITSILSASKSWWAGGVLGGIGGIVIGFIYGFLFTGIISIAVLIPLGLMFDFFVSKSHSKHKSLGTVPWWIGMGRGGRGGRGGGFGGFGGGMSGGGGSSGSW